jgi:hypothetical protein
LHEVAKDAGVGHLRRKGGGIGRPRTAQHERGVGPVGHGAGLWRGDDAADPGAGVTGLERCGSRTRGSRVKQDRLESQWQLQVTLRYGF